MAVKQPDLFLSFKRDQHAKLHDKPELEVAVRYDLFGEIDERNNWREPDEEDHALTDELRKVAARGLNEAMRYILGDGRITKRGAMKLVLTRLVALGHLCVPESLSATRVHIKGCRAVPGPPLALRELAAMLGCSTRDLRRFQRQYLRQWGFKIRVAKVKRR